MVIRFQNNSLPIGFIWSHDFCRWAFMVTQRTRLASLASGDWQKHCNRRSSHTTFLSHLYFLQIQTLLGLSKVFESLISLLYYHLLGIFELSWRHTWLFDRMDGLNTRLSPPILLQLTFAIQYRSYAFNSIQAHLQILFVQATTQTNQQKTFTN